MDKIETKIEKVEEFLICERKYIYELLMITSGMMGAYTFIVRGGVFCNAQTANIVLMSIKLGQGDFRKGLYYLIPIFAYFLGAFISEILPNKVKRRGHFRFDTILIFIEIATLFLIGFVPTTWPHHFVQVIINFIASMQYNTFRQAEGIPMATTFCTNHVRQVGIAAAKYIRKKDVKALKRGKVHVIMLLSFIFGGISLAYITRFVDAKAIWLAIIPLSIILINLVYADTRLEHDQLSESKPHGH